MAVQQNKPSRSKRGMRRSHSALTNHVISMNVQSGEMHIRHHITKKGFYRNGRLILKKHKGLTKK